MNITLIAGDITKFNGDAIVNAANNIGLGGGGVDGAIHRAAGPQLYDACKDLPIFANHCEICGNIRKQDSEGHLRCSACGTPNNALIEQWRIPTSGCVPTPAFLLPCQWVLHTVGPVWPSNPDDETFIAKMIPLTGMLPKDETIISHAEEYARMMLRACYKQTMLTAFGMGLRSIAYPAISAGVYGCPQETCAEVALQWALDYNDWPIDVTFYLYPEENLPIWRTMAVRLGVIVKELD